MAHPMAVIKGGYFAFENHHVDILKKVLRFPDSPIRVLDATAADGEAIIALTKDENISLYANELEDNRATALIEALGVTHAIHGDMFQLDIAPQSMQMIFANPPFNQGSGKPGERSEVHMTDFQWRWLQVGGVMVIVSYLHHITAAFAKQITKNAVDVQVYTFHDKHLDTYDYSVILATKHHEVTMDYEYRAQQLYNQVQKERAKPTSSVPLLDDAQPYIIPAMRPVNKFYFTCIKLNIAQLSHWATRNGPHTTRTFEVQNQMRHYDNTIRPAMDLTFPQMVDAVANGALNGAEFCIDNQRCIMGAVQELKDVEVGKEEDDDVTITEYRSSWVATTFAYFEDGHYIELDNEDLSEFIKVNEDQFTEILRDRLRPRYSVKTLIKDDAFKQEIFPILFEQRIKGVHDMYPAQIQVTAAGIKLLDETGKWLLIGATGTGKTAMAIATMDAMYQRGKIESGKVVVVITPKHVVGKFAREIRQQLPHSQVFELSLKEDDYGVLRRIDPIKKLHQVMKTIEANPNKLNVLVIARNDAKYGETRQSGLYQRNRHIKHPDGRIETQPVFVNPVTGSELLQDKNGEVIPISPEACVDRAHFNHEFKLVGFKGQGKDRHAIYDFDQPLDKKLTVTWGRKRIFNLPAKGNGRVEKVGDDWWSLQPDEPIVDLWLSKQGIRSTRTPRVPFWKIIQKKYADKISMVFADEVHEDNDPSADISQTLLHLAPLADYLIGMTATVTNGYADSMRLIATLFMPSLMKDYPYGEVGSIAWTTDMGVLKKILREQKNIKAGANSDTKRISKRVSASPGISVKMTNLLFQFATVLEIDDMGQYMVAVTEKHIPVDMSQEHSQRVNDALHETTDYLEACNASEDYTYSGPYYQFNLRFPDQVFVDDKISKHTVKKRDEDGIVMSEYVVAVFSNDDPYTEVNGKELRAIELVSEALPKGHGVGFYVQSSGSGNIISKRLKQHIEAHVPDAKVCILESKVDGLQRETWLNDHVQRGYNVLITNPKIVETGLDLLYFNELYFVEPEHRLRTLEQASGRSYRLPQTRPCTIGYMSYTGTMQDSAIQLMMEKKKASAVCRGRASSSQSMTLSASLYKALEKLEASGGFDHDKLRATLQDLNTRQDTSRRWQIEAYNFQAQYTPPTMLDTFQPVKEATIFKVGKINEMPDGTKVAQLAMF